jgi:hypothetical protein
MAVNYEQEIIELVRTLSDDQKLATLDYLRSLKRPHGEPGWKIVQHIHELGFDIESLDEMERAIEEAFEEIEGFPEVDLDD